MGFVSIFGIFILISLTVAQSSLRGTGRMDAGPCESTFNSTILGSLNDVSLETVIMDAIEVMSHSRGELNDWIFRTCRSMENAVTRANQSCSDNTINHNDAEEHASSQKTMGLTAAHDYICSNAGANLRDLVLSNGPQCIKDIKKYWQECPSTPSRTYSPTDTILSTYSFTPDTCRFLVSTEACYMAAFNRSNICIGNSRQHFQTFIGIFLEKTGCSDRNVFGRPLPIGFSNPSNFNYNPGSNRLPDPGNGDMNQFNNQNRFNSQDRFGGGTPGTNQFNSGQSQLPNSNQFPNLLNSGQSQQPNSNQFPSGSNQFNPGQSQQPNSNQFPSGSNQFNPGQSQPPNSNQFPSGSNQNSFNSNQFGNQNRNLGPVTPRGYNNTNYFNSQNPDPYSKQFMNNQNTFNQNYPNGQNNQNNPNTFSQNNPNGQNNQNFQNNPNMQNNPSQLNPFMADTQYPNSQGQPFPGQFDPNSSGSRTTSRPGFETTQNPFNRSRTGVYQSQGYKGNGSETISSAILSLILTLISLFLIY